MTFKRVNGLVVDDIAVIPQRPPHEIQYCESEHERRLAEMITNLNQRDTEIVLRAIRAKMKSDAYH